MLVAATMWLCRAPEATRPSDRAARSRCLHIRRGGLPGAFSPKRRQHWRVVTQCVAPANSREQGRRQNASPAIVFCRNGSAAM